MLELYHWEPNTFFLKPLIALKEKQAAFTSRYFDPTRFEQFAPAFPRNIESGLHLEREGPVLVHDGTIISSSFFMLEYIADALPGVDLYPGNAYQHYRARAWGQFLTLSLGPGVCALGCAKYLAPALRQREPTAAQGTDRRHRAAGTTRWPGAPSSRAITDEMLTAVKHKLQFPLQAPRDLVGKDPWLAGPAYSVADIEAFAMLNALPDLAPDLVSEQATPRVIDFINRMRERPAVRDALAMSRTGKPLQAFVPGTEASRWG